MVAGVAAAPDEPPAAPRHGSAEARPVRELRGLVPFEVAAVVALAIVPLPERLPVALPLLVVASVSRWIRGRSWGERVHGDGRTAAIGVAAGSSRSRSRWSWGRR
jgi:hypothetical protein